MVVHDRLHMEEQAAGSYGSAVAELGAEIIVDACCDEDHHCELLVDKLRHAKTLKHFVHCGSLRVYNPLVQRPWQEDGPRGEPCGYLTLQQQKMEARLLELHRTAGFPATVLLLGELVGEGWCPLTFQGLYDPTCFVALQAGKWVMLPQQQAILQILDVRDAVDAVCAMLAKPEALGESWNLCGDPLALKDYALGVSRQNGWPDPQMKPRTWLDFSYAMDKDNLHAQPNAWRAPEAADALWRITLASPNKVPALQCSALPVY
jgi:nucleoside-diphosphate-sugar epimerase